MSIKQKQALGGLVALWLAGMVAYLENQHLTGPADGCQVCDCSGAVVALPGAVTPAADVSAVTAAAQ